VPDIEHHLRSSGLRCTAQRFGVLQYLAGEPVHATADEIYHALNRSQPLVSRATVYNTLNELTRAGLVREFPSAGSAARYDANLHRHHHFVCDHCGGVEDLAWFDLPSQSGLGGHSIRSYEVIFRGTCRGCTSKSAGGR
jgi:Fur family peroxide stress response transcriptional regulator